MIRSKHRSTLLNNDEELGMIHEVESFATTDNHESTPLRQATTSDTRRSTLSGRSTTVSTGRGAVNPFGSSSRSPSRSWCDSGIVIKLLSVLSLVSWSTFVLSIRFVRTAPLSSAKASIVQKPAQLRGNRPMKLSLWLIPSDGEKGKEGEPDGVYDRTQTLIDDLAAEHGGPKFMPHVTLGGATVSSEAEALALAEKLRTGLSGYGPVNCYVGDTVLSEYSWNQALVFELVPPFNDFLGLCAASRNILGVETAKYDKDNCLSFPPPLRVPHMSLYYGISPPPPSETYLSKVFGSNNDKDKTFQSHRVMLWITDPSSLEGVPEWEPIADISLL